MSSNSRTSRPKPSDSPSRTILIADDDVTNRTILESMLRKDGHRVVQACDGKEAIAQFRQHDPDLVLMDVMMPGLDGYGATRRLRDSMGDRYVPIVFLTGMTDEEALIRCFESGGDGFLRKPYSRALLRAHIDAHDRRRTVFARRGDELDAIRHELDALTTALENVLDGPTTRDRADDEATDLSMRTLGSTATHADNDRIATMSCPDGRRVVFTGTLDGVEGDPRAAWVAITAALHATVSAGSPLSDLVVALESVVHDLLPDATCRAALAMLDPETGELLTWCCGGCVIVVRRADGSRIERAKSHDLPFGAGGPGGACERRLLADGDRVTLVSSSFLESVGADGTFFGIERLESVLANMASDESATVLESLATAWESFRAPDSDSTGMLVELAAESCDLPGPDTNEAAPPTQLRLELDAGALRGSDPLPDLLDWIDRFPEAHAHRATIGTILGELYTNALDHGVLGLDRKASSRTAEYLAKRDRALEELRDGWIGVSLSLERLETGGRLEVIVTDSGDGFDHEALLGESTAEGDAPRSGGLTLLRSLCTDFSVCGTGNRARAVFDWAG